MADKQEKERKAASDRDLLASLSLLVLCLAFYVSRIGGRSKLIAWLDNHARQMKAQGVKDVHLSHIKIVAEGLREDGLKPFYDILRSVPHAGWIVDLGAPEKPRRKTRRSGKK